MALIQKYGIKFPISVGDGNMTLFDLNRNMGEQVRSDLMHVIFTPKGQVLRNPEFGTNLIQFIFNPSTSQTFSDIVSEIKQSVKTYVPNCTLNTIDVLEMDNGISLVVKIRYSVLERDGSEREYELITKL